MDIQRRENKIGNNIYLIGMMGSGKTTVGKLLAEKLDYGFFDTDVATAKLAQKTITEIFATEGEARFRELESQTLKKLSAYTHSAIATGAGIVARLQNWNYLRTGLIVWLDADLNLLNQRLAGDNSRPLANRLESLLATRRSLYAQADLHIVIKPEQTPEDIVTEIIDLCNLTALTGRRLLQSIRDKGFRRHCSSIKIPT